MDCRTGAGVSLPAVHVARVKAAASRDVANNRKREFELNF